MSRAALITSRSSLCIILRKVSMCGDKSSTGALPAMQYLRDVAKVHLRFRQRDDGIKHGHHEERKGQEG